jgi:hypothetical protein
MNIEVVCPACGEYFETPFDGVGDEMPREINTECPVCGEQSDCTVTPQ